MPETNQRGLRQILIASSIFFLLIALTGRPAQAQSTFTFPEGWQSYTSAQFLDLCDDATEQNASEQDKTTLANHARDTWLTDSNYLSTAPLSEISGLMRFSTASMSLEQQRSAQKTLLTRLEAVLATVTPEDFKHGLLALVGAQTPGALKQELVSEWVAAGENWKNADATLAGELLSASSGDLALHETLRAHFWPKFMQDSTFLSGGDVRDLSLLLACMWERVPLAQLTSWVDNHFATVAQRGIDGRALEPWEIMSLSLSWFRLERTSQGNTTYANAVVRTLGAHSMPDEYKHYWLLAYPLASTTARDVLRQALVDAEGNVNQPVAKMLGWTHRVTEELPLWKQELDGKLADQGLTDEKRVQWLAARAYADEIDVAPSYGGPSLAEPWMNQGLALSSEPARLQALEYLYSRYVLIEEFDQALSLLDGLASQFSLAESQARIQEMRDAVPAAREKAAAEQAKKQHAHELLLLQGQLEYLQDQVAAAQAQGRSTEDVQSLQQAVESTQLAIEQKK